MHLGLNACAGAGKVRMKKGKTKSRRIDDKKQPGLSLSATHKDDGRGACCKVTGTLKKKCGARHRKFLIAGIDGGTMSVERGNHSKSRTSRRFIFT